jgi:hypothetical protein
MKKIIIYLLIFIVLSILTIFLFSYEIKQNNLIVSYSLSQEAKRLDFFNKDGDLVSSYSIEDFRTWAKENWSEIFDEAPSFGDIRPVEIDNFRNFSKELSISNDKKILAFVVYDYAVLVDLSFIAFIDLKNFQISMIDQEIIGSVRDITWSDNDKYIAYLLDTARTYGDYLRVDELENKSQLYSLEREDIFNYLEISDKQDLITFSHISWEDNQNILNFTTLMGDENEKYNWQYDINNDKLNLINNY